MNYQSLIACWIIKLFELLEPGIPILVFRNIDSGGFSAITNIVILRCIEVFLHQWWNHVFNLTQVAVCLTCTCYLFNNTLKLGDAYVHQGTGSSFDQVMASCLFGPNCERIHLIYRYHFAVLTLWPQSWWLWKNTTNTSSCAVTISISWLNKLKRNQIR